MFKFEDIKLNQRYLKAEVLFRECINNPENSFLVEESSVPLHSIIIQNEFVRVTFSSDAVENYMIETKIKLLSPDNKELGWYSYIQDESENVIDDFLVFI